MNFKLRTRAAQSFLDELDAALVAWMSTHGLTALRLSLGLVFLWFGALKLFAGHSPAEDLVRRTVFFLDGDLFLPVLAVWESLIGLGLLVGKYVRVALVLLFLQMPGTMLPLLILPGEVWTTFPFDLTLEGQYIMKNLVLIGGALVLGGTLGERKQRAQRVEQPA